MPLLHTRGPETFTSLDVGSCFIIIASDVFILTYQASNGIYYVTTDQGTPRCTYYHVPMLDENDSRLSLGTYYNSAKANRRLIGLPTCSSATSLLTTAYKNDG
jgi:hypothetical protein